MARLKERFQATIVATILAAALGPLAGYWWGRSLVVDRTEASLDQYALHIRQAVEEGSTEARITLDALNSSPGPYCSDAEIAAFRGFIFRSRYLKDAGRMRDGRIDCSASLGLLKPPGIQLPPGIARSDGSRLFTQVPVFEFDRHSGNVVQRGSAFVVYNPYNVDNLESLPLQFTVTDRETSNGRIMRLLGNDSGASAAVLTREGRFREDGTLFATRCSERYSSCMTAYLPVHAAFLANRAELTVCIVAGGLCGALVGLILSIIYRRNRGIEQQLRRAIRRDRLSVAYQPIVELSSGRVVAAEALARWRDEDHLPVSPEVFIRIAEDRGFIGEITRLVVRHVLRDFSDVMRSQPDFSVSVNITAADLADPSFLPMLSESVDRVAVSPRSLAVEITESSTARRQVAMEAILRLRRLGHCVHIDDFGTGYSSLAYLHDLSVDAIKIDRSFTRAIGTQAVTVAILPQILAMARALQLQVIVEGIETEEQARHFAASSQPILAQGWYFGRPMRAEDFKRLLQEQDRDLPAANV